MMENYLNPPDIDDDGEIDLDDIEALNIEEALDAWKDGE